MRTIWLIAAFLLLVGGLIVATNTGFLRHLIDGDKADYRFSIRKTLGGA